MDFWAVIGRICSDATFHADVFSRTGSKFPADYFALESLKNFLVDEGFRLTREDVLMINQIVKLKEVKGNVQLATAADDKVIEGVRIFYAGADPAKMATWTLVEKSETWGVLGLACIDEMFADHLQINAKDADAKGMVTRMLVNGDRTVGESPRFRLGSDQLDMLVTIFAQAVPKVAVLKSFDQSKWEQPNTSITTGACSKGHVKKHFKAFLEQPVAVALQDAGAARVKKFFVSRGFLIDQAGLDENSDIKAAHVANVNNAGKESIFSVV